MKKTTFLMTALSLAALMPAFSKEDPYAKENASWISLSGTVTTTNPDSFRLDYGEGIVTVEMDDWDFDNDGYKLLDGDEVTVYGLVDDDLFETTTIEASSVYVKGLNTYFYASSADEEDIPAVATVGAVDYDLELRGTVTNVSGREFTLDAENRQMRVDTSGLSYNPLDEEGFQKIEVGDRVSVTGDIDLDWWEKKELMAESVITLDEGEEGSDS